MVIYFSVRYAKMLVVASKVPSLCLDIVFPLVAVLSERSPFLRLEANVGVSDESDSSDEEDNGRQIYTVNPHTMNLCRYRTSKGDAIVEALD